MLNIFKRVKQLEHNQSVLISHLNETREALLGLINKQSDVTEVPKKKRGRPAKNTTSEVRVKRKYTKRKIAS